MSSKEILWTAVVALGLLLPGRAAAQDDKVFKSVTNEQVEAVLKNLGIDAKKVAAKTGKATHFDFERNRHPVRLYNYDGKDLMLDAVFPRAPWEIVNEWNRRAKFSRAVLLKDGDREATVLESNLDCLGGVTTNIIKQFVRSFDDELKAFDNHLSAETGRDEKIYPKVTNALLEKLLQELKIEFQKSALKNEQGFVYDFKRDGFAVRLSNYNGSDLMIDAQFKKATLAKINKWNNTRKFVRAVSYQAGGRDYTSLEANFDCAVGASENMIRHFIVTFDAEVKDFAKYLDKE
jgi:hypothetical protein